MAPHCENWTTEGIILPLPVNVNGTMYVSNGGRYIILVNNKLLMLSESRDLFDKF